MASVVDNLNQVIVRHGHMYPFDCGNQADDEVNEIRDGKDKRRTHVFWPKARAITKGKAQADVNIIRQWTVPSKTRFEID